MCHETVAEATFMALSQVALGFFIYPCSYTPFKNVHTVIVLNNYMHY